MRPTPDTLENLGRKWVWDEVEKRSLMIYKAAREYSSRISYILSASSYMINMNILEQCIYAREPSSRAF